MQLKIWTLCLISLTLMHCKNPKQDQNLSQQEETEQPRDIVGGWKSVEVNEQIESLAEYALTEKEFDQPIKSISSAKQQVVSGMNYGFDLELMNGDVYQVVIYVDLQGNKQVSKWAKLLRSEGK